MSNKIDLIGGILNPTALHTFFSNICESLTKINHMLSLEANLNKFQRTKIITKKIYNHSGIELEVDDDIKYITFTHKTITHY